MLEGRTRLVTGASGEFEERGSSVAADNRSPEATTRAVRDGIEDDRALLQAGVPAIDALVGMDDTGHDSLGPVEIATNGARIPVDRTFGDTGDRESVVDGNLGGMFGLTRTLTFEPVTEGSGNVVGQVRGIGGEVAR